MAYEDWEWQRTHHSPETKNLVQFDVLTVEN